MIKNKKAVSTKRASAERDQLSVYLAPGEKAALAKIAKENFRSTASQAAFFLRQAVARHSNP